MFHLWNVQHSVASKNRKDCLTTNCTLDWRFKHETLFDDCDAADFCYSSYKQTPATLSLAKNCEVFA